MVAVRACDLASPLRNGAPLAAGDRSALVIGGTERIRAGDVTVFLKVVAVAPAEEEDAQTRPLPKEALLLMPHL